ncbi:FtsB family cell division protein, partial [Klebsiella pneumoniae]|uniref:FtsB family cell division protein n=1 Tax=Klebsiella pneumoniae TaxID=573 RepID=UPI00273023FA
NRKAELAEIEQEIERLKVDIRRLTPGSMDPDYVEALARDKLAFVYPGEIVLLTPERSSAN